MPTQKNKFVGWISNIQGSLYFHLFDPYGFRCDKTIGDIIYFSKKIDVENEDNFIFWSGVLDFRDNYKNNMLEPVRCFFIAKSKFLNDKKCLIGKFILIDNTLNDKHIRDYLSELEKYTVKCRKNAKENNVNIYYEDYLELVMKLNSNIICSFNVTILKNGLIQLTEDICRLKTDNQDFIYSLYLNIFIVIKSFFHKDRFHSKAKEHVNLVVKKDGNNLTEILKRLIYYIQRYIAEERKRNDENSLMINATNGVSNYLLTLIEISKKYIGDPDYIETKKTLCKNLQNNLNDRRNAISLIGGFAKQSLIGSVSLIGVYDILKINSTTRYEVKKEIAEKFFFVVIEWFFIVLLILVTYDYFKNRMVPFSLSNNPVIKFFYNLYKKIYKRVILYSNPTFGKNILTSKIFPYLRKMMRNFQLKIANIENILWKMKK